MLRIRTAQATVLACFALATSSACVHESAADRHFARLADDMSRLTSERDAVQSRAQAPEGETGVPRAGGSDLAGTRPAPDPDKGPVSDDPEDVSPRPAIKLAGSGGGQRRRDDTRRRDEGADPSGAGFSGEPGARPSALDPEARKAYEAALEKARSGRHRDGLTQMTAFLNRWPDHPYADNAIYWRAECLVGLSEPQKAITELEGLIARFPLGNKVPDALLKLSILYDKAGEPAKARAASERLERDFPKSDAAKRRSRKSSEGRPQRPKDPL